MVNILKIESITRNIKSNFRHRRNEQCYVENHKRICPFDNKIKASLVDIVANDDDNNDDDDTHDDDAGNAKQSTVSLLSQ